LFATEWSNEFKFAPRYAMDLMSLNLLSPLKSEILSMYGKSLSWPGIFLMVDSMDATTGSVADASRSINVFLVGVGCWPEGNVISKYNIIWSKYLGQPSTIAWFS